MTLHLLLFHGNGKTGGHHGFRGLHGWVGWRRFGGLRDNWQKHNRKLAHEWVANEYQVARVPVLEGGGNSAVEVDTQEDGDCAEVTEAAGAGFEKAG
jgi:hypothetical protein